MIRELKTYLCDFIPSDEDIQQAIDIAKRDDCWVKLYWIRYTGESQVLITKDSHLEVVKEWIER